MIESFAAAEIGGAVSDVAAEVTKKEIAELPEKIGGLSEAEALPDKIEIVDLLKSEKVYANENVNHDNDIGDSSNTNDGGESLKNSDTPENDDVIHIDTINQKYEGSTLKIKMNDGTEVGIPYEKKTIEVGGKRIEGVFPNFDSVSIFDAQLPESMYNDSDRNQFKECNRQLKEAIENNPELRDKFTDEQIEQIMNGETPDGYTWHHDAESGRMQLVPTEIHQKARHTGGRFVWGGGSENR